MDDLLGGLLAAILVVFATLGVIFLAMGSFDETVIRNCAKHGYWQTGQTRVICSVEERK